MKDKNKVRMKVVSEVKKYWPGTKKEDIDSGKAEPYEIDVKQAEIKDGDTDADAR